MTTHTISNAGLIQQITHTVLSGLHRVVRVQAELSQLHTDLSRVFQALMTKVIYPGATLDLSDLSQLAECFKEIQVHADFKSESMKFRVDSEVSILLAKHFVQASLWECTATPIDAVTGQPMEQLKGTVVLRGALVREPNPDLPDESYHAAFQKNFETLIKQITT